MKTFHLTIARIGEKLFDGEAAEAVFPGKEGVFTVLPHHEALVAELKDGEVRVEDEAGSTHVFAVTRGVVEISHNQATVLL